MKSCRPIGYLASVIFSIIAPLFIGLSSGFCIEECYMYTPYEYQKMGGAHKIGPYASESECRSVNRSYFRDGGRCECNYLVPQEAPQAARDTSQALRGQRSDISPAVQSKPEMDREQVRREVDRIDEEARQRGLAEERQRIASQQPEAGGGRGNDVPLGEIKSAALESSLASVKKSSDLPFRPMAQTLFEKGFQGSPPVDLRDKPLDKPLIIHPLDVKGIAVLSAETLFQETMPSDLEDYPTALLDKKIEAGMPTQEKLERIRSHMASLVEKGKVRKAYALLFLLAAQDERYSEPLRAVYLAHSFGYARGDLSGAMVDAIPILTGEEK